MNLVVSFIDLIEDKEALCYTLQQEKNKLEENIKTLEKDLKYLEDENNKILSLENTKTKLEKDNASLKEDLKNYKQGNESLRKQIEEEQLEAEELKEEIDALKKREPELISRIKNIKENTFKPIKGKFSVIEQTIIKTEGRVSNLNKILKIVIKKINQAREKSKKEKSPNINIAQRDKEEEDKAETKEDNQKEKQDLTLGNIKGSRNEFESSKKEVHDQIASELKVIKERYKEVNELRYKEKLELMEKIEDCNKIIKIILNVIVRLKESTNSNVDKLKDVIHQLRIEAEKKAMIIEYSYTEKTGTEDKKEQSSSTEVDITKEERQKSILDIQSIIGKFIGDFELLMNKAQNILADEVKVTKEVVINQFKRICQLIYQRELKLVNEIKDSYEMAKEKLSIIVDVEDKVNKLESLMIKLRSEVSKKALSKGMCNIELIDGIYSHEIFRTGILKDVTKGNIYETKFIKLASEICCFCLKGKARHKAICLYHSKCNKCLIKTKKDCILCQVFEFKPLDFACDYCKSIVTLPDINILTCMHKKCNYCLKEATCKICKGMRLKLSVRVL